MDMIKEFIGHIVLGGVIFLIIFCFLLCYFQNPDEYKQEEREEAKYRHWDED